MEGGRLVYNMVQVLTLSGSVVVGHGGCDPEVGQCCNDESALSLSFML